jgi:hypothetical protein
MPLNHLIDLSAKLPLEACYRFAKMDQDFAFEVRQNAFEKVSQDQKHSL